MTSTVNPSVDTTFTAYKIPLSIIAKWPPANYVNPERRWWVAPYTILWTTAGSLLLAARLYSRWTKAAGKFGFDDILIVCAWIFGIAFSALAIWGVLVAGFDRHVWDVPPITAERGALSAWLSEFFFTFSTVFSKMSILVFHRRLVSRTSNKYMKWAIYAAMGFTIVYLLSFVAFLTFICSPTNASWKSLNISYNEPYKCAYRGIFDPMWGIVSVVSDVYAIVLPEILVKRLQIKLRQKLILAVLFGCGISTVATGIARSVFLRRLSTDPLRDLTWIAFDTYIFTVPECHLAIICASAPALKGFFDA
ncbi:hypothetical protein NA57DRAFT_56991 [Rhizodiscina lignyota]|uniref:Rhodopsin domain-containing protein n=1 Tax=Rhizodiscina lignyota TaxID=1504668 RepID=A0A9P4M9H9_9PEZI|nr:hypothetical protein NA57DRAFT_56991 [Rhizodiscina lignyota]